MKVEASPPDGHRPAHRPSRVDEVVQAAVRVFSQKGVTGTRMADVAEACGLGTGAVYYHFASKDQLFAEAVTSVAADLAGITGQGGTPPGSLADVVRAVYDWYAAEPEKARLFFLTAPGSSPTITQTWTDFVDRHVEGLYRYVDPTGVRRGPPRAAARELAPRTAIGTANLAAMGWLAGDLFGRRATRHGVADAVATVMTRLLPQARR